MFKTLSNIIVGSGKLIKAGSTELHTYAVRVEREAEEHRLEALEESKAKQTESIKRLTAKIQTDAEIKAMQDQLDV